MFDAVFSGVLSQVSIPPVVKSHIAMIPWPYSSPQSAFATTSLSWHGELCQHSINIMIV
jgi:hypothetical protein